VPAAIMLVEDNPGDIRLMQELLSSPGMGVRILVAHDGVEALEMLMHRGTYADIPLPDFILLDLNLPRMDGRELLAYLKADPSLKSIPVVVLTSSQAATDIVKSYELRASAYLCKPQELAEYEKLVTSIHDFWVTNARFPSRVPGNTSNKKDPSIFPPGRLA
jgi:chemotaxis family two-component system response regulator Rcp1